MRLVQILFAALKTEPLAGAPSEGPQLQMTYVRRQANGLENLANFDSGADLCELKGGYGVCVMAYNWERAPYFRERHPTIMTAGRVLAGITAVIAMGYLLTL